MGFLSMNKIFIISIFFILILLSSIGTSSAEWFNSSGTDHSGADWAPADTSDISGRHYNISTFTITNGFTVNIDTGIELEVFADTIHVYGTLDGDGHGGAGVGNGGVGGSDSSGAGGGGGAGYGGAGSIGKSGSFGSGGSAGPSFGDTTTKIISLGSTGGNGGTNSGGYGIGGLGGASVLLYGDNVIISGTISCNGVAGTVPGQGGGGGGGSGGGILIVGIDLEVTGTLSVDGGYGGNSGSDGDGAGGGGGAGRIKLVNSTSINTTGITTSITGGIGGTGTTGVAGNGNVGTYNIYSTSPPSTPTVITPINNSDIGSTPVTLNVTATDTDGDTIDYYYYGDTVDGSTYLSNSSSFYGWSIGSNTYLWKARAHDGFMYSPYISIQTFTSFVPPVLYTPSNTSTQYTTFPPLLDSVSFTWQDLGASQYRVMVAEDVNFNVMAVDTHVGTNNSNHNLLVNKEYFWKVYAYDGSSYSGASPIYQFNLTGNSTLSGSAIEGVCYSDIDGTYTALSGTEVTIWNETWSDTVITGSNGYYLFTDVTDGNVYNVQAKKDLYLDSSVALVNATSDPVTENFYLLPDRTSEEWRHYVKFIVWGPAGYYEGVTVTVYKNSDVTALYTADTGNDGAATFIMDRQQQYRVTAIDASQGINRSMTLYPKDEKYLFFVASTTTWTEHEDPQSDIIDIEISTSEINSTHAYINVSYTDSMSETSSWSLYLNQSNSSNPYTQNTLQSTSGATSSWTHSFIVDEYKGQGYWVNIKGVHTTYGVIDEQYSVMFEDEIGFDGIPQKAFLYIAILVMMFTGGMFGASTAPQGAMIICVEGWMFLFFGWFSTIDNNGIIAVGLGAATVVAIIANINQYSKKEGHE